MSVDEKILTNQLQELKRGTLVLAVLLSAAEKFYGYSLVVKLQEAGIDIEQNTLYPLLRRLESQGLLTSDWDTEESRPRKYYVKTEQGTELSARLGEEWTRLNSIMTTMMTGGEK
jgi:PadR family transcriptional regulator PadR